MTPDQFEVRVRELEAMTGSEAAMELFNQAYETLLNEVKALPGSRYEKVGKMRALVYRQFMFLFRRWREEKGYIPKNETNEIIQ